MAGFAEILSGIGDAAREDRLRKQHEEEVHSKGLGDIISQQIQDPNLTEEERGQLQQTLFGLASGKTKAKQAGELALKTLIKMNAQPKAAPVSGPVDPNVASTPQAAPVLAPPPAALRALLQLAPPPPQTASAMPLGGLPDPWGQPSAGLETLLSSQAETAPQAQPQPGVLPPPPGQPTPEPAMQPESRFWETMNTGYRAGSVGDKAIRAKAQQEWQHMRMIADAQERAAKEKEDREYARRLKELAEIEKSTGKQFNPVQRANFLHGQRLEEFPPPPEAAPVVVGGNLVSRTGNVLYTGPKRPIVVGNQLVDPDSHDVLFTGNEKLDPSLHWVTATDRPTGNMTVMGFNPKTGEKVQEHVVKGVARGTPLQGPQGPQAMVLVPTPGGGYTAQVVKPGSNVPEGAVTPSGMNSLNVPTAATRMMAETAPKVIDLIGRSRQLVTEQQKTLGPAVSRWNEFMAGKVGAPNQEFTRLRTNVGLLHTLLMRMHVGARGGERIMEHFADLLSASKQSPDNLLAAMDEIESYAKDVASLGHGKSPETGTKASKRYNPQTGRIEEVK